MTNPKNELPRVEIPLEEEALPEAQVLSEIHWLTFSMALKAYDQKASRSRKKEEPRHRSVLTNEIPRLNNLRRVSR